MSEDCGMLLKKIGVLEPIIFSDETRVVFGTNQKVYMYGEKPMKSGDRSASGSAPRVMEAVDFQFRFRDVSVLRVSVL